MLRVLSWYSLPVSLAVLGGCEPTTIGDPASQVLIYGRVTGINGATVSGASIRFARAPLANCDNLPVTGEFKTSDGSGRYRVVLVELGTPSTGCIKGVATAPVETGLRADSVSRTGIQFKATITDSVEVDFVLRPAA